MSEENHQLLYDAPANCWNEALPLGNGRIGAMFYGGISQEKISLNEETLWSGYPKISEQKNAWKTYEKAQKLVIEDRYSEAEALLEKNFGDFLVQMYLPFGDLIIDFLSVEEGADYQRKLSLRDGIHSVHYNHQQQWVERESFLSYPDNVLAIKIKTGKNKGLNVALSFNSLLQQAQTIEKNTLYIHGNCPVCEAPYGKTHHDGDGQKYYAEEEKKGVGYLGGIMVGETDGKIRGEHQSLIIEKATFIEIFVTIQTSFAGYQYHPVVQGREYKEKCRQVLTQAKEKGYSRLRKTHTKDVTSLYNRTEIQLKNKGSLSSSMATNKRLQQQALKKDNGLYALAFHYGKYLTIAGSRKGTQPTNLQGIWNDQLLPPWSSNYTLNINTQMNYWPTLLLNLPECAEPMNQLAIDLCQRGKKTAKEYYNAPGAVSHHATDLWRATHPSTNRIANSIGWGFWNASSGWLARHLYEYYIFTEDKFFLEYEAYPTIKEFARFYSALLIEQEGELMLCPATSPENQYLRGGKKTSLAKTTTMTMMIVKDVFSIFIAVAKQLGDTDSLVQTIKEQLPRLYAPRIGPENTLLEWDSPYEEVEPHHRHISHLYGLFPGKQITEATEDLWQASKESLEKRGDGGTGWSLAWKANCYAMLQEGEKALEFLTRLLQPLPGDHLERERGGGSYPNLFSAHPPFQIDGNYGITAAIANMLYQTEGRKIKLLPALPLQWEKGELAGMALHGNATISFSWADHRIERVTIETAFPKEEALQLVFPQGKTKALTFSFDDGEILDLPLAALLTEYKMRATFYLIAEQLGVQIPFERYGKQTTVERLGAQDAQWIAKFHEIGSHTTNHKLRLSHLKEDVDQSFQILSESINRAVRGLAYPGGEYTKGMIEKLDERDILYARTTEYTHTFDLPQNLLAWHPTCRYYDERIDHHVEEFQKESRELKLFHIIGHSYEMEQENAASFLAFENLLEKLAEDDTVWYATNGEIAEYLQALSLTEVQGDRIINRSTQTIYAMLQGYLLEIPPSKQ